ncbi:MAG: hypothetical protein ACRDQA_01030, partial [Nocardioidaceae bacterium]
SRRAAPGWIGPIGGGVLVSPRRGVVAVGVCHRAQVPIENLAQFVGVTGEARDERGSVIQA